MKKSQMKRKLLAVFLAASMTFALCAAAAAEDENAAETAAETAAVAECAEHDWAEATYEAPKTCKVCGATEGIALKDETAAVIDGRDYSVARMTYEYMKSYVTFLQNYGSYASYFGYDTTVDPGEQEYEEGKTWKDLFLTDAVSNIRTMQKLADLGAEMGIEVTEEEKNALVEYIDSYESYLVEAGYASFDEALAEMYGSGVTKDMIVEDNLNTYLCQKVYSAKNAEFSEAVTEEELAADPRIDVRHVLLQATADENGEFSEQALANAKARAEAVMRMYNRGEMTEESFAELAKTYSEDAGSAENGGLYEGVSQGQMVEEFDAFCFDELRQPGDTAIVYGTNGGYAGYHVMYFVGANTTAAREDLADERTSEWYSSLQSTDEYEKTEYYDLIGSAM